MKQDSITTVTLPPRIWDTTFQGVSLEDVLEAHRVAVRGEYFSDILSHQWVLLSIQTAIFVFIVTALLAIIGLVAWKTVFERLYRKVKDNDEKVESFQREFAELRLLAENAEKKARLAHRNSFRSQYEFNLDPVWKIVWHIRYIEAFFDDSDFHGLRIRLGILEKEVDNLKKTRDQLAQFSKLEVKDSLFQQLVKISQGQDKDAGAVALRIFGKLSV